MTMLRLLADDLTGALDSAAPFSSWGPIQVAWAEEAFEPHRSLRALDSDTRDLSQALAQERVRAWLERDGQKGIAFKKIDSLLRGNTMAELDVCCRTERYATIVVAPAFPAQHRITKGSVQRARSSTDEPWHEVGPCLATVLPGARAVSRGQARGGAGVVVCDAASQEDLDLIARCAGWERPVLWCGTSGLARALSGAPRRYAAAPARRILMLLGSKHPATRIQLAALEQMAPGTQLRGVPRDPAGTADKLAGLLAATGLASLGVEETLTPQAAAEWFATMFDCVVGLCRPDLLVCGGGDTAHRLCTAVHARSLLVLGEWKPGFPVSRIEGGPWAGTIVITKAGAFGSPLALADLVKSVWQGRQQ